MIKAVASIVLGISIIFVAGEDALAGPTVAQLERQLKTSQRKETRYLKEFKAFDRRADQAHAKNLSSHTFWYLTERAEKANKKWQDARKKSRNLANRIFRAKRDAADARKRKSNKILIDDLIYKPLGNQLGPNTCLPCMGGSFNQ